MRKLLVILNAMVRTGTAWSEIHRPWLQADLGCERVSDRELEVLVVEEFVTCSLIFHPRCFRACEFSARDGVVVRVEAEY